jgi:tetraacyldisaccharide 4'-kinase
VTEKLLNAWYAGAWWLCLLRPLASLYLWLRHWHLSRQPKACKNPLPLLVVGNITVGGTGKTPLVVALVAALKNKGLRCAIISRGFGGKVGAGPHCVSPTDQPHIVGDEPLLLNQLTGVPVVVGWSRKTSIAWLAQQQQFDLIISDDGLQHHAIKGDVEWCLIDASRGLGNGFCIPAGPLREPPIRLAQVDQVFTTGVPNSSIGKQLQQHMPDHVIGQLKPQLDQLRRVHDDQRVPWPEVDKPIEAIAAIGHPQRFFDDLRHRGYAVNGQGYADHYQFKARDLPPSALIMTAKDAVKCKSLAQAKNNQPPMPWLYATQSLTIAPAHIDVLLSKLGLSPNEPIE